MTGGKRRVHAAAVRQPQIRHRRGRVDTAAHASGDALDDTNDMLGVAEANVRVLQLAEPLDVYLVGSVDQDVADGRIGKSGARGPMPIVSSVSSSASRTRSASLSATSSDAIARAAKSCTAAATSAPRSRAARARRFRRAAAPAGCLHGQVIGSSGLVGLRRAVCLLVGGRPALAGNTSSAVPPHRQRPRESASIDRHSISFDRPASDEGPLAPATARLSDPSTAQTSRSSTMRLTTRPKRSHRRLCRMWGCRCSSTPARRARRAPRSRACAAACWRCPMAAGFRETACSCSSARAAAAKAVAEPRAPEVAGRCPPPRRHP